MVIKARLTSALKESGKIQADLARFVGVSTAAVALWFKDDGKKTITLKHENLVKVANCLRVSPAWLTGDTDVKLQISNLRLVTDEITDGHVQIPQYEVQAAAGDGAIVREDPYNPSDYVTFKSSWIKRKGYILENLCVIYVRGDSMESRIHDGDVVLVCRDRKTLIDDRIYALNYGGMARLKRVVQKANGNIVLVSDNDPDGTRREEITPDTFDQLHLIGEAVWVGGDLR